MAFCTKCGTQLVEGEKFCGGCGKNQNTISVTDDIRTGNHEKPDVGSKSMEQIAQKQPAFSHHQTVMADEIYCFSCGSVIKKIAELCPKCGVKQNTISVETQKKSNIAFVILSIFFTIVGLTLYISSYNLEYIQKAPGSWDMYKVFSVIANCAISIGIIFSIISLYRKKSILHFWLCISPCIILALWNIIFYLSEFIFKRY
jgi:RNA polymerase subunit RPABC4/transcription elongation factor Spt4